ncbi:MAG: hypothetical protein K2H23_01650 [Oscillospiraceae bacterium]|nr:hypothetical protein [Oscillospiraceae bacterium]
MCIYYGNKEELTYCSQEHVLPAALGCHTKLANGIVSDQANKYFSPIERDVIERSLIQFPRIIQGPGKRGTLSPKYATTSGVSVVEINGKKCLGYMKGTKTYICNQFVIDGDKIHFIKGDDSSDSINHETEINELKQSISNMGGKYVPIDMGEPKSEQIFITLFKKKIHIGFTEELSDSRLNAIKEIFQASFAIGKVGSNFGQPKLRLEIIQDNINVCILAAKTAINTLTYITSHDWVLNTSHCNELIDMIMSGSKDIFSKVYGLREVSTIKKCLHIKENQHACILFRCGYTLKACVFFYDFGYLISLANNFRSALPFLMDGIVCDWEHQTDYRYLQYLHQIGILQ